MLHCKCFRSRRAKNCGPSPFFNPSPSPAAAFCSPRTGTPALQSGLAMNYVINYISFNPTHQNGRVVKALDLSSNGRNVRVGSNPTSGKVLHVCVSLYSFPFFSFFFPGKNLFRLWTCTQKGNVRIHDNGKNKNILLERVTYFFVSEGLNALWKIENFCTQAGESWAQHHPPFQALDQSDYIGLPPVSIQALSLAEFRLVRAQIAHRKFL